MIFDIDYQPWMKSIAIDAANRGIAILGFQRYRNYWYVMVYGETDVNGFPHWAGVKLQEFIHVKSTDMALPYVLPRDFWSATKSDVSSVRG